MVSKKAFLELISELRQDLSDYHYSEFQVSDIPQFGTLYQIMTPRRWMVRYICAVLEVQNDIFDIGITKDLLEKIRVFLSKKYALFPWWKELGTFTVLICHHELYERLKAQNEQFKDVTGLHMNVMLGTVFIDRDKLESFSNVTWGLFYSGNQMVAINRVVRNWCKQHHN